MKEMYLIFNDFTRNYIYYEKKECGVIWKNRQELERLEGSELIKKLDSIIDKKRKSILHLENLSKERLNNLKNYLLKLSNSKVFVKTKK